MTTQTTNELTTEQRDQIVNAAHNAAMGLISAKNVADNMDVLYSAIDMIEFVDRYNGYQSIHDDFQPITITFHTFVSHDEKMFSVELRDENQYSSFLNEWIKNYPVDSHFNIYRYDEYVDIDCYYNA